MGENVATISSSHQLPVVMDEEVNYETLIHLVIETSTDEKEVFYMLLNEFFPYWESTTNNTTILDALVGLGKTEATVTYLSQSYLKDSFKTVYSAESICQVLEVVLRFRRKLLEKGSIKCNVDKFLLKPSRFCLNFDGLKDKAKVSEILNSNIYTDEEKNFVTSIKCETNKYKTGCKLIFATHASVFHHTELFKDFDMIFDELPSYSLEIVDTRKDADTLKQFHIDHYEMCGEAKIDPSHMSKAVYYGLINVSDVKDKAKVVYHLQRELPFRKTLIMSSFATIGFFGSLIIQNDWSVVSPEDNKELAQIYIDNLDITVYNEKSVTNMNTEELKRMALKHVRNPSSTFVVSTGVQGNIESLLSVRTNKRGLNALSNFTECIVLTQLNYSTDIKGLISSEYFERLDQGSKLTQSIFRGCVRQRKKMKLYLPSYEAKVRILAVLEMYLND